MVTTLCQRDPTSLLLSFLRSTPCEFVISNDPRAFQVVRKLQDSNAQVFRLLIVSFSLKIYDLPPFDLPKLQFAAE